MATNNLKYTDSNRKQNRNKIVAILLILLISVLAVGTVLAYYSDTFGQSGELNTATLKINGNYTVTLNGSATTLDSITSLNPGDVIVVSGTIENIGSQSAWVREKITFASDEVTFGDYLRLYDTALTQADLTEGGDYSANLLTLTDGVAVSSNRVIDGTTETAASVGAGSFTTIGATSYSFSLTVYFMHAAPNSTQGKTFNLSVFTQALQFANNNASEPNESAWATVVAA